MNGSRRVLIGLGLVTALAGGLLAARGCSGGMKLFPDTASGFVRAVSVKQVADAAAKTLPGVEFPEANESTTTAGQSDSRMIETHLNFEGLFHCRRGDGVVACPKETTAALLRAIRSDLEGRATADGMTVSISREVADDQHYPGFQVEYVRDKVHGTISARVLPGDVGGHTLSRVSTGAVLTVYVHEFVKK